MAAINQMATVNLSPYLIIGAALTLTVSLAWNDAIQSIINSYYPTSDLNSIKAKLIYAVVLTIIILVTIAILNCVYQRVSWSGIRKRISF